MGANWLFLWNHGELSSIENIVDQQLHSKGSIVGLATRSQGYYYKKALYQRIKPNILVLGSSRVMQFKQTFFATSMVNAGGAMNNIQEGTSFVKDVFSVHVPKIVIIGLDYWWFNENAIPATTEIAPPPKISHQLSLRKYLLPYQWLWEKKITLTQYKNNLDPFAFFNKNNSHIGVDGMLNQNGFAQDGSYLYTKIVTGKEKSTDEQFALSFDRVEKGGSHFEYAKYSNQVHINNLLNLLGYLRQHYVKVILFIPPLAPAVVSKMKEYSEEFLYIQDLRRRLQDSGIVFQDYHDPEKLATTNCEFVDGIHGGDVVYAKILLDIARHYDYLEPLLQENYLVEVTQQYRNFAMIPQNNAIQVTEIDFLKIQCDKSAQIITSNKIVG